MQLERLYLGVSGLAALSGCTVKQQQRQKQQKAGPGGLVTHYGNLHRETE
jgi:hypothetical protein